MQEEIQGIYPLTSAQQGILFHSLDESLCGVYINQYLFDLHGEVNLNRFQDAWNQVIKNNDALRASFFWEELSTPLQVVALEATIPFEVKDWRHLSASDQRMVWEQLILEDRAKGFTLQDAPLMRITIVQISEDQYQMIWSFHHLILDGWSSAVLLAEVLAIYDGEVPQITPSFASYAAEFPEQVISSEEKNYWKQVLSSAKEPSLLPIQKQGPKESILQPGEWEVNFDLDETSSIRKFAAEHNITEYSLLLAAWTLTLSRYTNQSDVMVGVAVAGRSPTLNHYETRIGMYMNTLPFRASIPEFTTISDWLQQIQKNQLELKMLEHSSLAELQALSPLSADSSLFDTLIAYENYPMPKLETVDFFLTFQKSIEKSHYPLMIIILPGDTLRIRFVFEQACFEVESIERLSAHFVQLLHQIKERSTARLRDLVMITKEEEQQLLAWQSGSKTEVCKAKIHELFEQHAAKTPDQIALVWQDELLTYEELNKQANQLANYLLDQGVCSGDFVAVAMPRSIEMVVALIAILKTGAAYVPVDLEYPMARMEYMLDDSTAKFILTHSSCKDQFASMEISVVCMDQMKQKYDTANLGKNNGSIAYIIYTSGSTGKPKGVMVGHESVVHFIHWAQSTFSPQERKGILASTSICFDLSVFELFFPLSCGAMIIGAKDALEMSELPARDHITLINTVPSAISELLELNAIPSSVQTINLAGEALSARLVQDLYQLPHIKNVYNLYGPTEDTVYSTYCLIEKGSVERPSIGKPILHTEAYVLDHHQQVSPIGIPGELYLGGKGLALGYLNRPSLTEKRFIAHPFKRGEKLYRTGDLVCLREDGELFFLGRMDDQVKIRGFRVELGEIETILDLHPVVQKSIVVAREGQLIAYVKVGEKGAFYREYLQTNLPGYMIPNLFVELSEFPLTPNGKIDRQALPNPIDGQVPVLLTDNISPLEEIIRGIWIEVLGKEVSVTDNFFEVGGHSLLATQVISRIARIFHVVLPIRSLFQSPTIRLLTQDLEQAIHTNVEDRKPILPRNQEGLLPLTPAQKRVWFLEQITSTKHVYHVPYLLRLSGSLHLPAWKSAFRKVLDRHASLRTCFVERDGVPFQVVHKEAQIDFELIDLRSVTNPEHQAKQIMELAMMVPFDLTKGPLTRMKVLQLGQNQWFVFFLFHHLVIDGWSWSILQKELFQYYEGFVLGNDVNLEELPIQATDYALHLEKLSKTNQWEKQIEFWKEQLKDVTPLLLSTDYPRSSEQTFQGKTYVYQLPKPLSEAIVRLSRQQGTTTYMTLLSAFLVLLHRYTGQVDIAVGTPIAGRDDEQLEDVVGFFAETTVIRTNLAGNPSFRTLLQQVRECVITAYSIGHVPFDLIVDAVVPDRRLSHSPLFQVMFTLQHAMAKSTLQDGLSVEAEVLSMSTAKFDLTVAALEEMEGITLTFEYNSDLFSSDTILRTAVHFERILAEMGRQVDQQIGDFSLLSSEEEQTLDEWNETSDLAPSLPILEQITAQVNLVPNGLAVVQVDRSISYAELEEESNRLANYLLSLGVKKEDRIAICVPRSIEQIVAILAVVKIGAVYVPLDPNQPVQRLTYMVADSGVSIILTTIDFKGIWTGLEPTILILGSDSSPWSNLSTEIKSSRWEENQPAYMVYTSGSTGNPKGVCITYGALQNLVCWHQQAYSLTIEDRTTMLAGPGFDASVWEMWPSLAAGATLVIPPEEWITEPSKLRDWLIHQGITISFLPTPLLTSIISIPWSSGGNLRYLLTGGDKLHIYPSSSFPVTVVNHYGPTENTVVSTAGEVTSEKTVWAPSIGKPISGVVLYVLDAYGQRVPIGIPGELYIGGVQLASHYHNQPERTAAVFVQHDKYGRLYRTGDRVRYQSDGNLQFLGRMDRQINLHGFRVELGEIESVIAEFPEIQEVVVELIEDRLVAYVVTNLPTKMEEVRDCLQQKLPSYMIPAVMMPLVSLPLTENGKVNRSELPVPNRSELLEEHTFVAPRTILESQLAEIWSSLLRVEQIGIHDNFFQLGGDSIISMQVVAKAREKGILITTRQIFSHQTISELGRVSRSLESMEQDLSEASGEVKLTPIQQWFFSQKMGNIHHFNQSMLLTMIQPLDTDQLTKAIHKLVEHHDALRLRFSFSANVWKQYYQEQPDTLALQILNITHLSIAEQDATIKQIVNRTQTSLHLEDGPLFRFVYFKRGEKQSDQLYILIHHLIIDGVSWRILLDDMARLYQQLTRGETCHLPAKSISYQKWSEALHTLAKEWDSGEKSLFWQQQKSILPLPEKSLEKVSLQKDVLEIGFQLSREETQQLLKQCFQVFQANCSELLLAALMKSYHIWSGNDELSIDLESHGREESIIKDGDLSRTVGWFTSIFPVRLIVQEDNWGNVVPKIITQFRQIPQNGIGYGILRYVNQEDLPSSVISFNYLGQFSNQTELWTEVAPGVGNLIDPNLQRPYLLEILSVVKDEQLEVKFSFDESLFSKMQLTTWLTLFQQQLSSLIKHCAESPESVKSVGFPLIDLSLEEQKKLPANIKTIYPLSPLQKGMLFHSLYDQGDSAYVVQMIFTLKGEIQSKVFWNAWNKLLSRHPQLSTSLVWEGLEVPHQMIVRDITLPVHEQNWSQLSEKEYANRFSDYLMEDRQKGFLLNEAPLMRVALFSKEVDVHDVVWSYHHTLLDGWSMAIILDEWLQIYQMEVNHQDNRLPEVDTFETYITWLQAQSTEDAQQYWSKQLMDAEPAVIAIEEVTDREKNNNEWSTFLSTNLTAQVLDFAKANKLTINTVIQATWGLFLAAYSGQTDFMYGTTVAGRPDSLIGAERIVGPFINSLPVRIQLTQDQTILNLLTTLQKQLKDAEEYAYVSLTKINEWSTLPQDTPLFHYLFVMENYQMGQLMNESVQITGLKGIEKSHYPLVLVVAPGEQLYFKWMFDESKFSQEQVEKWMRHYIYLLEQVIQGDRSLVDFDLLTAEDKAKLLSWQHVEEVAYPLSVLERIVAHATNQPHHLAVVGSEQELTYGELYQQASQLAYYLEHLHVKAEDCVGVMISRSPDLIVSLMAIHLAGAAYVPIDPAYPKQRIKHIVENAGISIMLTTKSLATEWRAELKHVICVHEDRQNWACMPTIHTRTVRDSDLAYVIYTSGSTGVPKGVEICHHSLQQLVDWHQYTYELKAEDRTSLLAGLGFDATVWEIWSTLASGATLYLPDEETRVSPMKLQHWLLKEQITICFVPTSMCEALWQIDWPKGVTLRLILTGGDQLRYYPPAAFPVQVVNHYGPTECTVVSTAGVLDRDSNHSSSLPSIGRPIAGTQVAIVNELGQSIPIGVPGELIIAGNGLARGYRHQSEQSTKQFREHEELSRVYKTGDIARFQMDGQLYFLGRKDDQVQLRGFRIELGEIEATILQHPMVTQTAVIIMNKENGERALVAFIQGSEEIAAECKQLVEQHLPVYMHPVSYNCVPHIPFTANGKLDRKELQKRIVPSVDSYVEPRTPMEQKLALIWEEVLHTQRKIGVEDNFFQLGGQSLLATQVMSRVNETYHCQLSLRTLFEHPTIAGFVKEMKQYLLRKVSVRKD